MKTAITLLIAAAAAVVGWLLLRRFVFDAPPAGAGGGGGYAPRPAASPYGALGNALCQGGAAYYGGPQGMAVGQQLCGPIGEALGPLLEKGVGVAGAVIDAAGNVIVTTIDGVSQVIDQQTALAVGILKAPGVLAENFAGGAGAFFEGVGNAAEDAWDFAGDIGGGISSAGQAVVSGVTGGFKAIGKGLKSLF